MKEKPLIQRIGIIRVLESRYGMLHTFTEQLYVALRRLPNLEVVLLTPDPEGMSAFLEELKEKSLQALIVFNSYFADTQGRLFCDVLRIPTLFCLVDSFYHFSHAATFYGILAFIDEGQRRFAEELGYLRVLDLPHAVEAPALASPHGERPYGCAMFSSGIDSSKIAEMWQRQLPQPLYSALIETAEKLLSHATLSCPETFEAAFCRHYHLPNAEGLVKQPLYFTLLKQLDLYVKGRGRVALLQGLQGIAIDLFGGGDDWRAILGDTCPHVTLHGEITYAQVLERMCLSKVVLNNCESIRYGAHERVFAALAHGAAVATADTPFLRKTFPSDDDGILYYRAPRWEPLRAAIARALDDEAWRSASVAKGQEIIAEHHLWKHRADTILAILQQWVPALPLRDPLV